MTDCPICGSKIELRPSFGLTAKQQELLKFIAERVADTGVPPSFDEMAAHVGLASKAGVHRLVTALEERGRIRRMPNHARAIEIIGEVQHG